MIEMTEEPPWGRLNELNKRIDRLAAERRERHNIRRDNWDYMTAEERELRGIRRKLLGQPVIPEYQIGDARDE